MSARLPLREYQREQIDQAFASLAAGSRGHLVVSPTGTSKTVAFVHLADEWLSAHPGQRVAALVHRKSLADQAAEKAKWIMPSRRVGLVKGRRHNDVGAELVIASVPTLTKDARLEQLSGVGLVIVDEAHHTTATSYTKIIDYYGAQVVGFTATGKRTDGTALGRVYETIDPGKSVLWHIRRGYLSDVESKVIQVEQLDLSGVRRNGDLSANDIGQAIEDSPAPSIVASKYRELAGARKGLLFAPSVISAYLFSEALIAEGISSDVVHGGMSDDEVDAVYARHRAGAFQVLCNCMIATEGYDDPAIEVLVIARITQSAVLAQQMIGRGLRPNPGKGKALVLFVGGVGAAGLNTLATLAGSKPVEPKEGQSFLEAMEELEAAGVGDLLTTWHEGPVTVDVVDLFGGSRQNWLNSRAGHWFIPTELGYVVIHPSRGPLPTTYDVAWYAKGKGGSWVARSVPEIGYAMAEGELYIEANSMTLSRKAARWRSNPVTQPAWQRAVQMGVVDPSVERESLTGGQVADLMAVPEGSARFDRIIGQYLGIRG